jgi:hypothetical protein
MKILFQCGNPACALHHQKRPLTFADEKLVGKADFTYRCTSCGTRHRIPVPPATPPPGAPPTDWGHLRLVGQPTPYPLRAGVNVVGRASSSSSADVQLPVADGYLSRRHCRIEVLRAPNGRVMYVLSDADDQQPGKPLSMNGTFVPPRPERLSPLDRVYLQDGMTLRLGQTQVTFHAAPQPEVPPPTAPPDSNQTMIVP